MRRSQVARVNPVNSIDWRGGWDWLPADDVKADRLSIPIAGVRYATAIGLCAVLIAVTGCERTLRTYESTDAFFKGGAFPIAAEFRDGDASLADLGEWSRSLLGEGPLTTLRIDIDGDRTDELFVASNNHGGNGGNSWLGFKEGRRGYRYLGRLVFGSLRPITQENGNRIRVLTSSHAGGCECLVNIEELRADGFHSLTNRTLPCGDCAIGDKNGHIFPALFENAIVSPEALRSVFGTSF